MLFSSSVFLFLFLPFVLVVYYLLPRRWRQVRNIFLLAASHCLAAVLRGAGRAVIPMISMLSFWCVVRVTFLQIMVPIFKTIAVVNWVYPLTWSLSTIFLIIYYIKADWLHSFEKRT